MKNIKRLTYDMKIGVVYRILNTITGKEYIGSTINFHNRKIHHLCSKKKTPLVADMNKYGRDKFEFSIIEQVSATSRNDLRLPLRQAEERHRKNSSDCYNVKRASENMKVEIGKERRSCKRLPKIQ